MDVARTALRKGVRHVSVFCRRYQTAASVREVDYAKADGVEFSSLPSARARRTASSAPPPAWR